MSEDRDMSLVNVGHQRVLGSALYLPAGVFPCRSLDQHPFMPATS